MVFFTCSHCGESVKKPAVAKHYQTKCRKNEPFLTCVDCLKDFKGNEYEAHTKCVTEDERYSAKGYVPKPSQNKGERKQQAWQECIQIVLKKPTLKADERDLIGAISKYENVPRKKAKFINFLSNAFRQYANKKDLIDRVWTVMESVFKEAASTNEEHQGTQEEKSQKQEGQDVSENSVPKPDENGLKKEKKKKRQTEELNETSESVKTEEKVKKKKHKSNEETHPENNTETITDETDDKREKKNKKRKKGEENDLPQTEQNDSIPDHGEPGKKKKKKKHTENEIDETAVDVPAAETNTKKKHSEKEINGPVVGVQEAETKSKKKKKSKSENIENNSGAPEEEIDGGIIKKEKKGKKLENKENCGKNVENGGETEGEKEFSKKKKAKEENGEQGEKRETFDWKETILSVLNGKNKIQLQKLQKKVLKRHCEILNCENSQKKEKKFMKKLKEIPEIEIDNDFVVLKS